MKTLLLSLVAVLGVAFTTPAQIRLGEFGFEIQGASGVAGDSCWGFDCRPRRLAVRSGEQLGVQLRAPLGAPFWILASASFNSCTPIPGLHNSAVLGAPILPVFVGVTDIRNTQRFCYDGIWRGTLTVPRGLPRGTAIGFQAVAVVGTPSAPNAGTALSSAVVTVAQ